MVKRQAIKGDGSERGAKSVRAVTASARIYVLLRDQIVGMELKPGVTLSEKDICDTFGVSRTPVREALLRLNDENLIDIFPQMGTFVSRISFTAIRDAMVVRQALERTTVREAAKRAARLDITMLKGILNLQEQFQEAGSFDAFHEADENFHQAIAAIAGHPNLWRIIKREKAHVDRFRMLTLPMPEIGRAHV